MNDISEYYTPELATSEEQAWYASCEHKRNFKAVERLLEAHRISAALDVGCGSGFMPTMLPSELPYVGIDLNKTFLDYAVAKNAPQRVFKQVDLRTLTADWVAENALVAPVLGLSFAVLKHFGLHEWNDRVRQFLSLVDFACFDVTLSPMDFDDGVRFHHVYVSRRRLNWVLAWSGHRLLFEDEKRQFDLYGLRLHETIVATTKVSG